LRATVSVKAEAKDNTGIKKVEVFVDGILLISATSSPVEASWDTKTVTDGTHQIRIIATDIEGNKQELILPVEIKNILFTFKIGASYLSNLTAGWIFVTDDAGELISSQEMINGETITVETPEGFHSDKTFTFSRLEYYFDNYSTGSYKDIQFYSYTKISSDAFILDNGVITPRPAVGNHDLIVTGIPFAQYENRGVASLDAQGIGYVGPTPSGAPIRASLFKSPAKVVYWMQDGGGFPIKYEVPVAASGGSVTVDFSAFTPVDSYMISIPGSLYSTFYLSLVRTPGDYNNTVYGFSSQQPSNPDRLTIFYPNLNPIEYIADLYYRTFEGYYYFYTVVGNQPPTVFKTLGAEPLSITSASNTIDIKATGDFQIAYANASDYTETNNNSVSFNWNMFMNKDFISNIRVPFIPDNILKRYPDIASYKVVFDYVTVEKYSGVGSYKDWVKLNFSSSSIYSVAKEIMAKGKYFTPGGRMHNVKERNFRRDFPGKNLH
jgi:hypothetical protein